MLKIKILTSNRVFASVWQSLPPSQARCKRPNPGSSEGIPLGSDLIPTTPFQGKHRRADFDLLCSFSRMNFPLARPRGGPAWPERWECWQRMQGVQLFSRCGFSVLLVLYYQNQQLWAPAPCILLHFCHQDLKSIPEQVGTRFAKHKDCAGASLSVLPEEPHGAVDREQVIPP